MAATEPTGALMRMADARRDCADCLAFALLRDAIASALLQGGLGQPMRVPEALPSPMLGGGHVIATGRCGQTERDPLERVAKVRATLYACLAAIDRARKSITGAARYGDGVPKAVWVEILHHTAIIQKQAKKARETLAATALRR